MLSMFFVLALVAIGCAHADTEFVIDDPGQGNVQVVHFSSNSNSYPSKMMGMTSSAEMMMGYTNPRFNNMIGRRMNMMNMMRKGRTLENYFRTYLKWLYPYQKAELVTLRNNGASREQLIKRVSNFFDMLPMGERRDKAMMLMNMACQTFNEMVFGKERARNLHYAIDKAAAGQQYSINEIQEYIDEMANQVDDVHRRSLLAYYLPMCKHVISSYMNQMMMMMMNGGKKSMMHESPMYNSKNMFEEEKMSQPLYKKFDKYGNNIKNGKINAMFHQNTADARNDFDLMDQPQMIQQINDIDLMSMPSSSSMMDMGAIGSMDMGTTDFMENKQQQQPRYQYQQQPMMMTSSSSKEGMMNNENIGTEAVGMDNSNSAMNMMMRMNGASNQMQQQQLMKDKEASSMMMEDPSMMPKMPMPGEGTSMMMEDSSMMPKMRMPTVKDEGTRMMMEDSSMMPKMQMPTVKNEGTSMMMEDSSMMPKMKPRVMMSMMKSASGAGIRA